MSTITECDRHWEVLTANGALGRVFGLLGGPPTHTNVLHQIFDPADMRPFIVNWEEVAGDLIRHLHAQVAATPTDTTAKALLDDILAYPGVPAKWRMRDLDTGPAPLLTTLLGRDDVRLSFFSTFSTFGTPRDVTLDELRIECLFPADEATAGVCRRLAEAG